MKPETHTKSTGFLVLGDHRYDRSTGRLEDSEGRTVHLRHQSARVLAVLAEHSGQVVTRDTLLDEVWPDTATTEDSLVQCIADIRRTLGRETVQTFPKKGYCLRPDEGLPAASRARYRVRPVPALLGAVTFMLIAILAVQAMLTEAGDSAVIVPPPVVSEFTLAVLPFANLGGDPDLRFFSDGLSEDLVTDLSKVSGLTVISPHSSFDYRNAETGFRQIAEDLGTRYLVRGTVRHDGERVRINVSLIDPERGLNLWAERYDRSRGDPFNIQEEVSREIAGALSLELGADERSTMRAEPDAYYMLLRGLQPLRNRTGQGNLEARAYFYKALEFEPRYARAHANIAVTYGREAMFDGPDEVGPMAIQRGLEAAVTAIQLNPEIPSAYFALGVLNLAIEEHDNALAAVRHAIRLDPNYSDAYALLAEIAVQGGDLDEALDAIRRAKLLHPHYPFSYDWIEGHALFQLGRYEAAEPFLQAAVDRNPLFVQGQITLAANLGREGKLESAKSVLNDLARLAPDLSLQDEIERSAYRFDERRENLAESLREIGWKP